MAQVSLDKYAETEALLDYDEDIFIISWTNIAWAAHTWNVVDVPFLNLSAR